MNNDEVDIFTKYFGDPEFNWCVEKITRPDDYY